MTQLLYDGTMAGLLSAVFDVYDSRLAEVRIVRSDRFAPDVFSDHRSIATDALKARRVWMGLGKRVSPDALQQCWQCFLSEIPGMENTLLTYFRYAFSGKEGMELDYGHPAVLEVVQTARKVWREKHRMEAFVRFRQLRDGLFFANVEPDYNVLPLIVPHFRSRYADMDWLIYDLKRRYGIYHDKRSGKVGEVQLDWMEGGDGRPGAEAEHESEAHYQALWQNYFKHTGIPARKNPKLHLQHIPARYWRYLTEKQPGAYSQ